MRLSSLLVLLAAACTSSSDPAAPPADPAAPPPPGPDVSIAPPPPAPPPRYPALHPKFPQAETLGGRVLHAPRVVTITFEGDAYEADVRAFDDAITSSPYWKATTSEYCDKSACIGPGTGGGYATLPAPPAAMKDADLRALLAARVADSTLPAPTEGTVYVVYLPAGTTITEPVSDGGETSCVSFHAYHEHMTIGSADVTYAALARCPDAPTLEAATMLASHELVEAATDPDLDAWYVTDSAWATWHGGELADVCLGESTTKEGTWTVERTYSSAAAKAGKHPCVPASDADEFGTAPPGDSTVRLSVGESTTIPLVGFAAAAGGDWTLTAGDALADGNVSASLDRGSANDGTPVKLKVTLNKAPEIGAATVLVRSKRGSSVGAWPLLVLSKP